MKNQSIEPHQLDFDWRFDGASQEFLGGLAADFDRILLLGCPSLMKVLDAKNKSGLLVERNPIHLGTRGFDVDYRDLRNSELSVSIDQRYDAAILDAPWYPLDLCCWIDIALRSVTFGQPIFFVLWPEVTRPDAAIEHVELKKLLASAGDVAEVGIVSYELPIFERKSIEAAAISVSARYGHLFRLIKRTEKWFPITRVPVSRGGWKRFTFGQAQIAIRVEAEASSGRDVFRFERKPFVLDSTSRRNPVLGEINVWTSRNLVAKVENPDLIARGLHRGFIEQFDFLSKYFDIEFDPKSDVRGVEWQHQA